MKGLTRKALLHFLLSILIPGLCLAQTSRSNGLWSSSESWTGEIVPSNGSSAHILHDIRVDSDTVVGESSAVESGFAIAVRNGATLTIGQNSTMTVRGNVLIESGALVLEPGAILQFDASRAAFPSATHYLLSIGQNAAGQRAELRIIGSPESRSIVRSVTENQAANASIVVGSDTQAGVISATLVDFISIGDETHSALSIAGRQGASVAISGSRFIRGGALHFTSNIADGATLSLKNVSWSETRAPLAVEIAADASFTSGIREIIGSVFDREVRFYPGPGFTIKENYFAEAFAVLEGPWASFEGNFIRDTWGERRLVGNSSNNYWLFDNPSQANPHFVQVASFSNPTTIDGDIFEFNGADGNGDCVLLGLPDSPTSVVIKNSLVLPNAAGEDSGTLFSALGNSNISIFADHNTFFAGSQSAAVGETYAGHSGMLKSFRSNIAWSRSRGYKLACLKAGTDTPDIFFAEDADYNVGHGLFAGSNGNGYDSCTFSLGTPGVHDREADPQFVDSTRDIAVWDRALGGPGTIAHALAGLSKRNDGAVYDDRYSIPMLQRYVRAGFVPTNELLRGSAHDGGDIGAVPMNQKGSPDGGTVNQPLQYRLRFVAKRLPRVKRGRRILMVIRGKETNTKQLVEMKRGTHELWLAPDRYIVRVRGMRLCSHVRKVNLRSANKTVRLVERNKDCH